MAELKDRRRHKRLPLELGVFCRKVGFAGDVAYTGTTRDVSTGGLLMKINGPGPDKGQLLSVDVAVPPTRGLLDIGGRLSGYARVVRIGSPGGDVAVERGPGRKFALEFCNSPKVST